MDEGDSGAAPALPGRSVHQPRTAFLEVLEGEVYRSHGKSNVMQTFSVLLQKAAHRGIRPQWLEELEERPADRDHRLLDSLAFDSLPVQRLDVITLAISRECVVEVDDCNRHMIQVEELHPQRLLPLKGGVI